MVKKPFGICRVPNFKFKFKFSVNIELLTVNGKYFFVGTHVTPADKGLRL